MDTIISIIVPIYNAEKFLASCIDSILSQTFKNFELLLIDDGSQDSSLSICQKYQQNDNRITVFHKNNEGVTAARKYGVEKAKGEYISFVDADDIIPENSLALLYKEHDNADMVIGNFIEVMPHYSKKINYTLLKFVDLTVLIILVCNLKTSYTMHLGEKLSVRTASMTIYLPLHEIFSEEKT